MDQIASQEALPIAVIISASAEWKTVLEVISAPTVKHSPIGDYFTVSMSDNECIFFHGGWGKVSAAAGTQYIIDRWKPTLVINIGTCGGFEGLVKVGDLILANETLIYDIHERMGDSKAAFEHYATKIDLSRFVEPYPQKVRVGRILSADQDIDPNRVNTLSIEFNAVAADWESGAIAWTASRNQTGVLILRVVSDLVSPKGGELYDWGDFSTRAREVMLPLINALPAWISCANKR